MNMEEAHLDQCTQEHLPQAISYLDSDEWLQLFHQPDPSGINNLRIAVSTVIDAIIQFAADTNVARSPWVKTSGRLPTEADADSELMIMAWHIYFGYEAVAYGSVIDEPEMFTYWMPIPPLPEVEE